MSTLRLQTTEVFAWNREHLESDTRYIINQGGSRSSKTYSILQLLIWKCLTSNIKVSVVRKTLKSMKDSVISDFIEIMKDLELYDEERHNKTDQVYNFQSGSQMNFFGADDDKKVRGTKRDILYINEANELTEAVFIQLDIRTENKGKLFIDYNPSDNEHFIYNLLERDNSVLIKSTYKNNPFLSNEQIRALEDLILSDENYYRIYVLGERPVSNSRIFTHFKEVDNEPVDIQYKSLGLDFGFNHATALVEVGHLLKGWYIKEKIYSSKLTIPDLISEMKRLNISKTDTIWADAARPDAIEEIRRAGYNIRSANKDVLGGINKMKSEPLYIDRESHNLLKELRRYSWKTNGDIILNQPVKLWDDACDAARYSIWNENNRGNAKDFYFSL